QDPLRRPAMPEPTDRPHRTCATMPHHFFLAETDAVYRANRRVIEPNTTIPRLAPRTKVIHIPVLAHVLYHTDEENISLSQIQSQIDALNRDYRLRNTDRS